MLSRQGARIVPQNGLFLVQSALTRADAYSGGSESKYLKFLNYVPPHIKGQTPPNNPEEV